MKRSFVLFGTASLPLAHDHDSGRRLAVRMSKGCRS